jgi:hypothetical protein
MEQDTEQHIVTPKEQLHALLHFIQHNHYAQGAVAAVVIILLLMIVMKRASGGKVRALEAQAQGGDVKAAALLGELYQYGEEGAPVSYKKAERWYRAAASTGNADGQNGLGSLYFFGQGVQQSYGDAFRWFELAAKQGQPMGQANLALLHFRGHGTQQNAQKAYFWALLAKTNPRSVEIQKRSESFGTFFNEIYNACPPNLRTAPEERAKEWKPEKKAHSGA